MERGGCGVVVVYIMGAGIDYLWAWNLVIMEGWCQMVFGKNPWAAELGRRSLFQVKSGVW